jgi:hypothetical protein
MGDRGQVQLIGTYGSEHSIYLYTHWGATDLENVVAEAMVRGKDRWSDDEYLNRIIFSEMIQGDVMSDTGYGIGLSLHGDTWKLVVVNHIDQTVGIKVINYSKVDWQNYNQDDVVWDWELEPVPFEVFVYLNSLVKNKE